MADDHTSSIEQPDLRDVVCEAVNQVNQAMLNGDGPVDQLLTSPITPDHVSIRFQRTWHDIQSVNPTINGGSFSACIAEFTDDDDHYAVFIEAAHPIDDRWRPAGMSGWQRRSETQKYAANFKVSGHSHVCVGGAGLVPDGGKLRLEMFDGTVHEDTLHDGYCIVFAPVTTLPSPHDSVTVRIIDADGNELSADQVPAIHRKL